MANVIVRKIDNRPRSAAEVKRLLHEIAFVLRCSEGIKMEILAGPRQREGRTETVPQFGSLVASQDSKDHLLFVA